MNNRPDWLTEPKGLEFKTIDNPFQDIYERIIMKLRDEQRNPRNFYTLAHDLVLISHKTYRAICKLVDYLRTKDGKTVYGFQALILARTLMDTFFVIAGLTENPKENSILYAKGGYRIDREDYEKYKNRYGTDAKWSNWLQEREKCLDSFAKFLGLSDQERLNPKGSHIPYWPNPDQLVKNAKSSVATVPLSDKKLDSLSLVLELRYDESSSLNHVSLPGLAVGIISTMPEHQWQPGKLESDAVYSAILFSLMILSEIEIECSYYEKKNLRNLWEKLGEGYDEANEFYELRYKTLL